jgi:hypothetical protein
MNRGSIRILAIAGALAFAGPVQSWAACTAADFGSVVDDTAQALRDLNANGAKTLQTKLKAYQQKYNLSAEEVQTRAETLQDDKMSQFNREIEGLVGQMDVLSQTPNDQITCEKLDELRRVRDRLLTIMGQKSGYLLAKADLELDRPGPVTGGDVTAQTDPDRKPVKPDGAAQADRTPSAFPATTPKQDKSAAKQPEATPAPAYKPNAPAAVPQKEPNAPAAAPQKEAAPMKPDLPQRREQKREQVATNWQTDSQRVTPPPVDAPPSRDRAYLNEPPLGEPTPLAPQGDALPFTPQSGPAETHYSIAEISDAGRGVFGTVSAQFGAAINYAFQQFGQPDAYITGSEGGGAVLAGLRYGKGTLFSKTTPPSVIYWQGPSLGYDLGAEGSDTMFLVYNLSEQDRIYGRFTGVGGAAYVAGGLGLNVLGKGNMIMVPIRTGVGLRIGANLAYLKFTERQTWNPF